MDIVRLAGVMALQAVLVLALVAPSATASTTAVQLPGAAAITISGADHVSAAGDVNGDGYSDLLLSEGSYDSHPHNGRVYVVFLKPTLKEVDVDELGDDGFVIHGSLPGAGASVAADAGDVNSDGLADIVVGAPGLSTTYVVFGKSDTLPVYLATFDANVQGFAGFRIDGSGYAGRNVSGVGDMNKDGFDDIIIGAPFVPAAYVVFGKPDPLPVSLSMFHRGLQGDRGFLIRTSGPDYDTGYSVSGLGDTNGEDIPDEVVGRLRIDGPARNCCRAWVVLGKNSADPIDVAEIGRRGYLLAHRAGGTRVGDVNGDGLADIYSAGVVFGTKRVETVPYPTPVGRGFRLDTHFGPTSSSGGGDVNGDGLADYISGVDAERSCGENCGAAYVVFGKRDSATVRGADMGDGGFRIDGPYAGQFAGADVAIIDDLNGDGKAEVVVAAPGPCCGSGTFYIVFGRDQA